jgi:RNA polymerase sigma-70 factor, ECF subfamily
VDTRLPARNPLWSPCVARVTVIARSAVDEAELIARARAGEPAAERALYERHVDRVYRLVFRIAGDDDLARDFTQDTFVRAFERLHEFRGEAQFSTWLHPIAVTVALNGLRKVKRLSHHETSLDEGLDVSGKDRSAEPDLKLRLAAAIDALAEGYRTVFVMHDVEGYTHEEIGAALGVEAGTSKAQLSRARAKLRVALADFAGEWVT